MSADTAKFNAAKAALDFIQDGMVVGLGTGSTSAHFVRLLGERVREGLRVKGVPTSEATRNLAEQVGVPLVEISQLSRIDVDVDGADEIDPEFRLIKGGGGALLREKIVAASSAEMVVIAFLQGRGYVTPQDIKSIGRDVLRHRIIVSYEAEAENLTTDDIITKIFDNIEVP